MNTDAGNETTGTAHTGRTASRADRLGVAERKGRGAGEQRHRRCGALQRPRARLGRSALRVAALFAGLVLAGSCVTNPRPDLPQDAVVTYETVRFETPGEDDPNTSENEASAQTDATATGGAEFATVGQPLVGDPSEMRVLTVATIGGTNLLLAGTLLSVHVITRFPPREAEETRWVWQGTNADDVFSRFTLTENGEGRVGTRFGYRFEKRLASEDDNALRLGFDGEFERFGEDAAGPGGFDERVRAGQGVIRYDFDALSEFDDKTSTGLMSVAFRSAGDVRQVKVFLREVQGENWAAPVTAVYAYFQRPDRSGEYTFSTTTDFLDDGAPLEDIAARVVWDSAAHGRVLTVVTGGSINDALGVDELLYEECWDGTSGATTWIDTTPDMTGLEGGAETDCAASLQGLDLARPEFEVPPAEGDPAIPAPHPDE